MNSASIVTLTGYADIFAQFRSATERREPGARKIVVTSRGVQIEAPGWEQVAGVEPFCFPRNANLGIVAAAPDDVLLVNDDVQFLRPGTLEALKRAAYASQEIGIVSPQFRGSIGGRLQNSTTLLSGPAVSPERLSFACVYLKRSVLDAVGPMDEQYDGYGCDDDDYSLRTQKAGLTLVVVPHVVVLHGFGGARMSASFSRTAGQEESASRMRRAFRRKHGIWPYGNQR